MALDRTLTLLSASPSLRQAARGLVEEYVWLPEHWDSVGGPPASLPAAMAEELERFPGPAVPPDGDVALAVATDGRPFAVGALVQHSTTVAELKRLYVQPGGPPGTGTALVELLLERSQGLGYRSVVLDVLASRHRAIRLYERLRFTEIPLYREYANHEMRAFTWTGGPRG